LEEEIFYWDKQFVDSSQLVKSMEFLESTIIFLTQRPAISTPRIMSCLQITCRDAGYREAESHLNHLEHCEPEIIVVNMLITIDIVDEECSEN
jgi:hypothetical protein